MHKQIKEDKTMLTLETATKGELTARAVPITQIRQHLTELPEALEKGGITSIAVTRRGEPVLALLPWALYEGIMETLEILGDEELMDTIRRSMEDIREGHTHSPDEVIEMLGL